MSIPEALPVGEVLRSTRAKSLRERAVTVAATFFLAAAFILAGAPAATAAPASMNNHVPSASGRSAPLCDGDCPGFCSDPPFCASLN